MVSFGRVITALVTPFTKDMEVNYSLAAELAEYLVNHGTDSFVVSGTTGESPTLTDEEKLKLFKVVKDRVGKDVPVILGTGTNSTAKSVALTIEAERAGADGILAVVPYYNKPTQAGLFAHFEAVAKATSLPVMLYNVPGRTGANLLPETVLKLAEIPNVVAIKEASGSLDQISQIISNKPDDFLVYSGDDSLTLPILSIGGYGVVSVASHVVGDELKAMISAYLNGEVTRAAEIHARLFSVFKALFVASNPIPVKKALQLLGFDVGGLRLPLLEASDVETDVIKRALKAIGKNVVR